MGPNSYILSLASDNAGAPGADLEAFTDLVFPESVGVITENSTGNPALSAGSTYWVVMRTTDPAASVGVWLQNDQGIPGLSNRYLGFNGWIVRNEESTAVAVNANAIEAGFRSPRRTP